MHSALSTQHSISVAMCTYNGAAYLPQQLASFAAQTRLPDELVICDDGSSDATPEIIKAFAAQSPFAVRVFYNESNLGSTKNFDNAISLCQGDIIALSDQDDIWQPEKLAQQEAAFEVAPNTGLVFTNATVVDNHLQPLPPDMWTRVEFGPETQNLFRRGDAFPVLCARNVVTGATLAFRSQWKNLVLPIPTGPIIHDGWIALTISAMSDLAFIAAPLVLYRQHERQQLGAPDEARPPTETLASVTPALVRQKRVHLAEHLELLETLHQRLTSARPLYDTVASAETANGAASPLSRDMRRMDANIAHVAAHIAHLRRRLALPASPARRLPRVLSELAARRYHRHSNGFRSAFLDLKP